MRLQHTTFTLSKLIKQIEIRKLDLHPDFQRGEVWTEIKKKRLIDSVLRNWYIPPIHLVRLDGGGLEVLDGQQRLVAIRDFLSGVIRVDGSIPPVKRTIQRLDNCAYHELSKAQRSSFARFKLIAVILLDYEAEEPGELFFRLNQLTGLTPAEQRNAFYGTARYQVKSLLSAVSPTLFKQETLGFSNTRMGYDDVIARVCFALDIGTHHHKVTAKAIEDKYRSRGGFKPRALTRARKALRLFSAAAAHFSRDVIFNKATLFSWLCFVAEVQRHKSKALTAEVVGEFVTYFESKRYQAKMSESSESLLMVFNDRASSRVADISSVLVRDFVIWSYWLTFCAKQGVQITVPRQVVQSINRIRPAISPPPAEVELQVDSALMDAFSRHNWGRAL